MSPRRCGSTVVRGPQCVLLAIVLMLVSALPTTADAQRRRKGKKKNGEQAPTAKVEERKRKGGKEQVFDFTGLTLQGSMRTPQLLYFLDRASEELRRASLERRSFVPEMVRSIDEEAL